MQKRKEWGKSTIYSNQGDEDTGDDNINENEDDNDNTWQCVATMLFAM